MANAAINDHVIIDEHRLIRMAADPRIVSEFPFMSSAAGLSVDTVSQNSGGCSGCKPSNHATSDVLSTIKQQIADLPPPRKFRLKELLLARRATVSFRVPDSKTFKSYSF